MRYIDRYAGIAADTLEKELMLLAETDESARKFSENVGLNDLLNKIKSGKVVAPSKAFEGFAQCLTPDMRYGTTSWASKLFNENKGEKFFGAVADLSNVLGHYRNDLEFASYCRRIGYTFPDGWPDNPELYAETVRRVEQEAAEQARINAEQARIGFKLKRMWRRIFKQA